MRANIAARIDARGALTITRNSYDPFHLTIPDDQTVLRLSVGVGMRYALNEELKLKPKESVYEDVGFSDKGDYANGVLGLFEGLQSAGQFFHHSYWRSVAEGLAKRSLEREHKAFESIKNKIAKRKEVITQELSAGNDHPVEWLSRYVLQLARQQHVTEEDISFSELEKRYHEQREAFIQAHREFRKDTSVEGIRSEQEQAQRDLRRYLQSLTDAGIFLQGVRVRCRSCGSRYWKNVDDLRQQSKCQGCGLLVSLPVTGDWRFKLNALVRNAIAFHGSVPVISALYSLRDEARNFFLFAPGLVFFKGCGNNRETAAELDLICISDGKFIIGEVKQRAEEFSTQELKKLARLAAELQADETVIAAFTDEKKQMESHRSKLTGFLGGPRCTAKIVLPGDDVFAPLPYP